MINRHSGEKQQITKSDYESNRHKKVFTNNFRFEKQGNEPEMSADELIKNHNEELAPKHDADYRSIATSNVSQLKDTEAGLNLKK